MYYVYILKSLKDRKLYIGYTNNLRRRLWEHNHGLSQSTKDRKPFILVYYEAFRSKEDAKEREKKLKQFKKVYTLLKKRLLKSIKA